MQVFSCPACGAQVEFKSVAIVFRVCSYCSAMLVRRDLDLENLGTMTEMPQDVSPLQIGTRGYYQGKAFELVGRLKLGWQDGSWNEWYACFGNGDEAWLSDAQGQYMLSFPCSVPKNLDVKTLVLETPVSFGNVGIFSVNDIKATVCLGSEGELPFVAQKGRKSTCFDLLGTGNRFASIDAANDGVCAYVGAIVDVDTLHLTGLRDFDGW